MIDGSRENRAKTRDKFLSRKDAPSFAKREKRLQCSMSEKQRPKEKHAVGRGLNTRDNLFRLIQSLHHTDNFLPPVHNVITLLQ